MIIIADSSNNRTDWVIADASGVHARATTAGLNPYFHTRREISHIIRLDLPQDFFRRRWDHIYFYGAGCANPDKNKMVESSLVAQFKTPATVESDLLGAARGLLVHSPGLACILSTGANSCYYDGERIVKSVRPGGYILGDEGSSAYMGKRMLSDMLKGIAPADITDTFFHRFSTTPDEVMDLVYSHPHANQTLASYAVFLAEHPGNAYCREVVYSSFMDFFRRNIAFYDYRQTPLSFVGSTCTAHREVLEQAAADFGVKIRRIEDKALPGLIEYHKA